MERLKYLLAEVDKPPTHHAMNGRDRAILHHASQGCAVLARQARRLTRRLAGDEPGGTMGRLMPKCSSWHLNLTVSVRRWVGSACQV